jgi:hypothetical protein
MVAELFVSPLPSGVFVAVFLASEQAGMITGVTVDITGGTTAGLNYRVASRS